MGSPRSGGGAHRGRPAVRRRLIARFFTNADCGGPSCWPRSRRLPGQVRIVRPRGRDGPSRRPENSGTSGSRGPRAGHPVIESTAHSETSSFGDRRRCPGSVAIHPRGLARPVPATWPEMTMAQSGPLVLVGAHAIFGVWGARRCARRPGRTSGAGVTGIQGAPGQCEGEAERRRAEANGRRALSRVQARACSRSGSSRSWPCSPPWSRRPQCSSPPLQQLRRSLRRRSPRLVRQPVRGSCP